MKEKEKILDVGWIEKEKNERKKKMKTKRNEPKNP